MSVGTKFCRCARKWEQTRYSAKQSTTRRILCVSYARNIIFAVCENIQVSSEILSELFELINKSHLRFQLNKCDFAKTEIKYNKDNI